jgi:ATP-dependent Clp protease ATP-binding subunit ClpC
MPKAIEAAVTFSIRYMPDRRLPDKAFDLIDQACAQKAIQSLSIKTEGSGGAYAIKEGAGHVGREDIARVISTRCRVPYELLLRTEQERLNHLEAFLSQRIIGQPKAIRRISHRLQASYQGVKDPRRPVASFLFTGPTGVGKTETAKVLAEFLFGTSENLLRIDLSEYTEKHQVSRLLGAPPGYVGYEEPGVLTSALRARPASVVLFDEIEKAHPDVLRVFLNILDEGELTDGQGRKASFREAIVILTSNITPEAGKDAVGFNVHSQQKETGEIHQERLIHVLQSYLRPELIGRIGHIILFESLTQESCLAIAENILQKTWNRLQERTLNISEIPEILRKQIKEKVSLLRFGARDIEHLVESEITAWLIQHRNPTK